MRLLIAAITAAALLGPAVASAQQDRPMPAEQAASVERFGTEATWRGLTGGVGYSEDARRRAECLASDQRYDPRIDRIRLSAFRTRACTL